MRGKMGITKRLFAVTLAFCLATLGIPASTKSALAIDDGNRSQEITDLLAAGSHTEGEVVAAVRGNAENINWFSGSAFATEDLLATTEETYVTSTEETLTAQETPEDDAVHIILIQNDSMSTEEMLYALWDDSRILMVEPNYVAHVDQDSDTDESSVVAATTKTLSAQATSTASDSTLQGASSSSIADATDFQWGLNNNGSTMHDGKAYLGFDINSPDWNTENQNACGVVAVFDTGIDVTNPDLDGVMMNNMKDYNPDGGDYGINLTDSGDVGDVSDTFSHGTHVAGIIASEWNDFGTSGVANGVKLVAIKAGNPNGEVSIADLAKGYAYLSKAIDNGLNLVAVNNSWGDRQVCKMLSLIVTQLGEKGVISVFSSGNSDTSADYNPSTPSVLRDNPYAIVVDGSNRKGGSGYNFSASLTDVYAPGVDILSTASALAPAKSLSYLAETDGSPLCKDTFDNTSTDAVKVYKTCDETTLVVEDKDRVGSISADYYFESGHSLCIGSGEMAPFSDDDSSGSEFYLKIPVGSYPDSWMLNSKLLTSFSDASGSSSVTFSLATKSTDTGMISWDKTQAPYLNYLSPTDKTWYEAQVYSELTLESEKSVAYDKDGCMTIRVRIAPSESSELSAVYLDCLGVGTEIAPYMYSSGTSMAAPMVTGAAAVAALQQGLAAKPAASQAAELARERVIWIESHVNQYDGRFLGLCSSGGQIDLSLDAQKTLPVISSAEIVADSNPTQLKIGGSNFGNTGSVTISGKDAEVVSWSDKEIVITVPDGVSAGVLPITVKTDAGSVTRGFLLEISSTSNKALFEKDIALPEGFSTTSMDNFMIGMDDKLYVFPQDQFRAAYQSDTQSSFEYGIYQHLWCYNADSGSWTQCPDLPIQLNTLSATVYEGELVVCGTVIDWDNLEATSVLYVYDPALGTWESKDATHVPYAATIVNVDGQLLLIGGSDQFESFIFITLTPLAENNIAALDLASGTVTTLGSLQSGSLVPKVAISDGVLYVAQGRFMSRTGTSATGDLQRLTKDGSGYTAVDLNDALPRIQAPFSEMHKTLHAIYSFAAIPDGLIISGVLAYADDTYTDFIDTDTFISKDAGASFVDFGKRVYRTPLYYATSAYTGGWLYVMGSSVYDDDVLVLRATQIETPTPPPTPPPTPTPGGGEEQTDTAAHAITTPNMGDDQHGLAFALLSLFRH